MFRTNIRRGLGWLAPPGSRIRFQEVHHRRNRGFSRGRAFLGVLLSLVLLSGSVPAQSSTSSVSGSVVDPQGKAVGGAAVTLTNVETNAVRTSTTNENGSFQFELVQPGNYQLEATASGFKKAVITDVRALVAKPTSLTVTLEVGGVTDTVTVSAGSADILINRQDASLGNNFVAQQIMQLPMESRNVVALLSLQAGVTPGGAVTGSRSNQGNITLDGVDVNEQESPGAFQTIVRVTPDSVEEFRVTTSNPNASQGRSAGAQVSLVTKGGTNQFRGSLYWSHRNTVTSANDFFNNKAGHFGPNDAQVINGLAQAGQQKLPTPKLLRNLFGATIGGPIKKDRLFFFYNYEGRRDASEASVGPRRVPLASLGRGEVSYRDRRTAAPCPPNGCVITLTTADINRLFPAVGANAAAIAVFADAAKRYPANSTEVGDGLNTGGFRFNVSTPARFTTHISRIDYNLTEDGRHLLFLRANYQQDVVSGTPFFPDTPRPSTWNHPLAFAVGHTWAIGKTLVNDARYGQTRAAFSTFGDSSDNSISFRNVFSPVAFSRTFSRTTPVHNITDDVSWALGSHGIQFGANLRVVRNTRIRHRFDSAVTNSSFYDISGAVLTQPIPDVSAAFRSTLRDSLAAVIGRFSQYSANIDYDLDGGIIESGADLTRIYATNEYDFYAQDSWKLRPNLTLTYGLRYGLSRPIYETQGFQAKPSVNLVDYFRRRAEGAARGQAIIDPITVDLAGPANDRGNYYEWDKNNFQPRFGVAWSPNIGGWPGKILGSNGDLVIRGGFVALHDFLGQALAVNFDGANALGFSSNTTISANSYNVTTRPAPPFTGFNQNVRALPNLPAAKPLVFPQMQPADGRERIEESLDDGIVWPEHYSWNVSMGRKLPAGLFVEASYVGRLGRKLLGQIDSMHFLNLVDSKSGVDWYTAAGQIQDARLKNTPVDRIGQIPYFNNLFKQASLGAFLADFWGDDTFLGLTPTQAVYYMVARPEAGGYGVVDWTFVQTLLDNESVVGPFAYSQPQYGSLFTISNFAESDYHALLLSVRQRYKESLTFDFNYTWSHSIDMASANDGLVTNPLFPRDSRGSSSFDLRHIVNANALWQLPVGRGKKFLGGAPGFVDALLGGWQLSGIFRYNTGAPFNVFDSRGVGWATNWNFTSRGIRVGPVKSSPTRGVGDKEPNVFSDREAAYQSFRNARAGESGDRNILRLPSFIVLDMGLGKTFNMPWSENHKLQFRWEVFNVSNTQRMGGIADLGLDIDPFLPESKPFPEFGNFVSIQGTPRVMQFGLRYTF
ncbi:MAG: TonB-dependent receptor [Acidobacteriota bacterium]